MYSYDELVGIIAELRGDHGCPWDKAQTHESLIPCLRDECEEVVQAIEKKDEENLAVCMAKEAGIKYIYKAFINERSELSYYLLKCFDVSR